MTGDARDAPVAIADGVNRHDVKVRHRPTHRDVGVEVAALRPLDHLAHQARNHICVGTGVRRRSAARAGDVDRLRAPQPRRSLSPERARVEMQVEDHAICPAKVRVDRHRPDVVHRMRVAREGPAVRVARFGDGGAGHDPRPFVRRYMKALD